MVQVLRLRGRERGQPLPHPRLGPPPAAPAGHACRWGSRSSRSWRSATSSTSTARQLEPARFIDLAVYLSFFPHLVAGPIVRGEELLPQIRRKRDPAGIDFGRAAWLVAARAVQEGRDLVLHRLGHRHAGVLGPAPALGARDPLRRLRVRRPDLRRLQRLHRHRHRPGHVPRLPLPPELRRPVHGAQPPGLLAALAHDPVALAARLPLHPPGRRPGLAPRPWPATS